MSDDKYNFMLGEVGGIHLSISILRRRAAELFIEGEDEKAVHFREAANLLTGTYKEKDRHAREYRRERENRP